MRKFFVISILAALAMAMSCQKDSVLDGDETAVVSFTIQTPDVIGVKSTSDGQKVNIVHWAAFDNNDQPIESLSGTAEVKGKEASFDVQLVKYYEYKFVFWAHKGDEYGQNKAYNLGEFDAKGKVTVNYEGNANDDDRDAFYKMEKIMVENAGETKTIRLYRPFAQINFLAADYKSVEEVDVHLSLKSTITAESLPTVLNGLDGTISEYTGATVLAATPVPTDPAYYNIKDATTGESTQYGWYSMNYVLASEESSLNNVTATFTHDLSKKPIEISVDNVPYKRNHRTNIIGKFLTETALVSIIVVEKFDDPDYNINEKGEKI